MQQLNQRQHHLQLTSPSRETKTSTLNNCMLEARQKAVCGYCNTERDCMTVSGSSVCDFTHLMSIYCIYKPNCDVVINGRGITMN